MRDTVASRNSYLSTKNTNLAGGFARFYSGTRPANGDASLGAAVLLATVTFSATAGVVSNGVLTFNAITGDSSADASGIPSFVRLFRSDGTTAEGDLSVGVAGSGAEVIVLTQDGLGNAYITVGAPVPVSSMTLTFPAAES